ncbi:MAG: hypothetical protein KGO96_10370 [Elusimicrobia bacterium]|nr:hypothetical protein [Elusimicrobiota bacterium]
MQHAFNNASDVRDFVLAGNATITLESQKTGTWFTYKVRQATGRDGRPSSRWFVSLMNGLDNESSFAYIGLLDCGTKFASLLDPRTPLCFRQTAKSRVGADAPSVRGFTYFWRSISEGKMPCSMTVRHEGKCGRCGRKLTVPESIDRGIGPECATHVGHSHEMRRAA